MTSQQRVPLRQYTRDKEFLGRSFGLLTVIRRATKNDNKYRPHVYYECLCCCGNRCVVRASHLRAGSTSSCGCLKRGRPLGSGKVYVFQGQKLTLHQWADRLKINLSTLTSRLANGWSVERMLSEPPRRKRSETGKNPR